MSQTIKKFTIKDIEKHIDDRDAKRYKNFKVDYLMYNIIKALNEKGYKTNYCCSGHYKPTIIKRNGHIYNAFWNPYIALDIRTRGFIDSVPVGWFLDRLDLNNKEYPSVTLRIDVNTFCSAIDKAPKNECIKWLTFLYNNLINWVNKLPYIKVNYKGKIKIKRNRIIVEE